MTTRINVILALILLLISTHSHAQDWKTDQRINLVFGLTQPLLVDGFNVEVNYIHDRFIFDYSHGISLDFSGSSLPPALQQQQLAVHMPWTTGFGVGYRIWEWLNVRLEPKWHRFEFYYENDQQIVENQIVAYNTFSLGIGVYGSFRPFKKSPTFLKGIIIVPSIRFWPTLASTLEGNSYSYQNRITNSSAEIGRLDPGLGFTPFVANISIGYSFGLKKKKG